MVVAYRSALIDWIERPRIVMARTSTLLCPLLYSDNDGDCVEELDCRIERSNFCPQPVSYEENSQSTVEVMKNASNYWRCWPSWLGITRAMRAETMDVVLIDNDSRAVKNAQSLDALVIHGDITSRRSLQEAGIGDASVFVATDSMIEIS